jgi:hypothetical protein
MAENTTLTAALDELDRAAEGVSLRPVDIGGSYRHVREAMDAVVAALKQGGDAELARVGRVIDNLMAGADTIIAIPSGPTGVGVGDDVGPAGRTPTAP